MALRPHARARATTQAEIAERDGLLARLRHTGRLTRVLGAELRAAFGLSPLALRAVRVWR
jgi:hypothetical protein